MPRAAKIYIGLVLALGWASVLKGLLDWHTTNWAGFAPSAPKKKPARWGRADSVLLGRRCCYEVRRATNGAPRR